MLFFPHGTRVHQKMGCLMARGSASHDARPVRLPPVLLYHGFGNRSIEVDHFGLFISIARLERQLQILAQYFRPLDLTEYVAGIENQCWPARSILLTIDDGYISTLEHAAPLLTKYRVPAVLFVPAGLLGGTSLWMPEMPGEKLLTSKQLLELSHFGIEIGVHSMDHTRLIGLSAAQLRRQIADSRKRLEDILGYLPRSFAYPEGRFDERTIQAVQAEGYEVAFSVLESGYGRLSMKRRGISRGESPISFLTKLTPAYAGLRWISTRSHNIRRLLL